MKININKVADFYGQKSISAFKNEIEKHYDSIYNKSEKGNDFLGWIDLPSEFPGTLLDDILQKANNIKVIADIFVVIGIGGSYLGARAVIGALEKNIHFLDKKREYPIILFAGHNISENYLSDLLNVLDNHDYAMAVISKSGTTTEPAIAFRLLKNHLEEKYGKDNSTERIIAITDKEKGALRTLADKESYATYTVPDDVGGRYSVLSPVGLLPVAVAGFDIKKLLDGAKDMEEFIKNNTKNFYDNPVSLYAAARNALYNKGKKTEILVNYEPELFYMSEWWKQLYGESEGKEHKGIFPAAVSFTTDLHSMGQYIQDGLRNIFETILLVEKPKQELRIPSNEDNLDKLNYISGKRIHEVNAQAALGTKIAHNEGDVPTIEISIEKLDEYNLGKLIYFFEMACAVSGYILGVNPFDQPGVEDYKNNMFALLGKPGFEKETEKIKKKLNI